MFWLNKITFKYINHILPSFDLPIENQITKLLACILINSMVFTM